MNDDEIKKDVRSCFGKHRYPDESRALKYVKKAMREREVKLRTYSCNICAGFHLTSKGDGK